MSRPKKELSAAKLALCGMTAAMVFVATYFLKLPVPMSSGYVHLGDAFVLIGAGLLGLFAAPAAALGSMLADLLLGYTAYALPTAIVKGLCAVVAALGMRRKSAWTRAGALILAEIVMAAGYFVFEWLVLGAGAAGALANVPGNLIQGASGVVIACALLPVLKKAKLTV